MNKNLINIKYLKSILVKKDQTIEDEIKLLASVMCKILITDTKDLNKEMIIESLEKLIDRMESKNAN